MEKWCELANSVLSDFETDSDEEWLRDHLGLVLRENVTEYILPVDVRRLLGVHLPEVPGGAAYAGSAAPYARAPYAICGESLRYQSNGRRVLLRDYVSVSGATPVSGSATSPSTTDVVDATVLGNYEDNQLVGWLVRVTHAATGRVEDRVVVANSKAGASLTLDGELEEECAPGDTYLVVADFLWLRYSRYLPRFEYPSSGVSPEAEAGAQPLPLYQDMESVFSQGLKYYAMLEGGGEFADVRAQKSIYDELRFSKLSSIGVSGTPGSRPEPRGMIQF